MNVPSAFCAAAALLAAAPGARAAPISLPTLDPHAVSPVARAADAPRRDRTPLLVRMQLGAHACFPDDLAPDLWEKIVANSGALPPGLVGDGPIPRYFLVSEAWVGDGDQGQNGRAQRANLTYSFPPDGASWGLFESGYPTGQNSLNAALVNTFGAADIDKGREYIRQAIAAWRRYGGLSYTEVADDGLPMSHIGERSNARGDIRIGGLALGTPGILGYNAFPSLSGSQTGGGDMVLNTSYFYTVNGNGDPLHLARPDNDYRYLRNTVAHEHGHGLGIAHTVPCTQSKLMEPQITQVFDMLTLDDIRAVGANYGDRFAGNEQGPTFGRDLGNLNSPVVRSVIERDLSTNGVAGYGNTLDDYFKFTLSSSQSFTITADPTGYTYTTAPQTTGCNGGTVQTIIGDQIGNLRLDLYNSSFSVIATAASGAHGVSETITRTNQAAGTYYFRVRDFGPDNNVTQPVQTYDLTVRLGATLAPPTAVAGLNKLAVAGANTWFCGSINSYSNEEGSTLTNYEWDFDGDGVYDHAGSGWAVHQFVSNGLHQTTLRVTDSNGRAATDTISVDVSGAVTTITGVSPPIIAPGTAAGVVITGTNLKRVLASSQVAVSGTGVTVSGTPVPNAAGTAVSGLIFTATGGAALGPRNVTITNTDGLGSTGTGFGVLTIGSGPPTGACCNGTVCTVTTQAACNGGGVWQGASTACGTVPNPTTCCRANIDGLNGVATPDIFAFLSLWFAGNLAADFDNSGSIAVPDIFAFLALWFAGC